MSDCKHHWHVPKDPLRTRKAGFRQARCCICSVRAWVILKEKERCCETEGMPYAGVAQWALHK